jgi:hypothetical protein
MAKFIEKATEFVTGKSKEERMADRASDKIAQQKINAIVRKEREEQNIRLARERIKAQADAKIKALRQPRPQSSFGGFGNYGSPFGEPKMLGVRTVYRKAPVRRRTKVRRKAARTVYRKAPVAQPRRFDVIGGGWR